VSSPARGEESHLEDGVLLMEKFIKNIFTVLAFASLLFMAGIIIVLF